MSSIRDAAPTETLSLQPQPQLTRVVHFRLFRWWVSAVMRHWNPGDSGPKGRCKLCPICKAYQDGCLTVVSGKVEHKDAPLLSINHMKVDS